MRYSLAARLTFDRDLEFFSIFYSVAMLQYFSCLSVSFFVTSISTVSFFGIFAINLFATTLDY